MIVNVEITVFTPTYNRAYIINRLYESLQRQEIHNFESSMESPRLFLRGF